MVEDGWLPVNQATALLGVSQRTLYRRIEAGQYRVRHVDGRTQVWMSGDAADVSAMADGMTAVADSAMTPAAGLADTLVRAVDTLERLLEEDRQRAEDAERRAGAAEQAAAMWQERARNLEGEVDRLQELMALPAHEEEPAPRRRWWHRWRT